MLSCMAVGVRPFDSGIPIMSGWSASGFHRIGKQCLLYKQRCLATQVGHAFNAKINLPLSFFGDAWAGEPPQRALANLAAFSVASCLKRRGPKEWRRATHLLLEIVKTHATSK